MTGVRGSGEERERKWRLEGGLEGGGGFPLRRYRGEQSDAAGSPQTLLVGDRWKI